MTNIVIIAAALLSFAFFQKGYRVEKENVIIDSNVSLDEALSGKEIPDHNTKDLKIISVEYFSFDHKLHRGQLVVDKHLADDLVEIFKVIKKRKFPVKKVVPVNKYDWDDEESMKDNNTSAFNYRTVNGTKVFSNHAFGRAIDINPVQNPEIRGPKISPAGAKYNEKLPGTIASHSWLVIEFKKRHWRWGGDWTMPKDYQHFEKPIQDKK